MLENILTDIIVSTFHAANIMNQDSKPQAERRMMHVKFHRYIDHNVEAGYRWLNLYIYAPTNYVFVGVQHEFIVLDIRGLETDENCEYILCGRKHKKGELPLQRLSYHDSCWKHDGVERFFRELGRNITRLDAFSAREPWFKVVPVTDEVADGYHLPGGKVAWATL